MSEATAPGPIPVIVANNMVMENETAHVLQTCRMLAAFAAIGCEVTYLWPSFGRTVPALAELPIRHRPIACRARYGKARYAEFVARLMPELYRLAGPGSVTMTRSLGVALGARLVAPRLVVELHKDLSPIARRALPLLGKQVRWVGISGALRDHLVEAYDVPAANAAACHDAVDFHHFAGAEPLPVHERPMPPAVGLSLVHLYYGTLRPERGLDLIAAAAAALPEHGFVLIGGTAAEVAAAKASGLDRPNVLVLPAVPHATIPRLLRSYDSALLPYTKAVGTHRWMSPLKLFETLASGTPAVVSRLGPVSEVVDDSLVAFIDCDRPGSLAEALLDLERRPEAARARARAGQQLALERYTWERRARDILDLAT
ncbi:MAG: glycosyltransferase family 4 protein [Rhodospirillaceae bacterium]